MTPIKKVGFRTTEDTVFGFEITTIEAFKMPDKMRSAAKHNRVGFYVMIYLTEGEGYHDVDFEKYHMKAGDLILMGHNRVQRYSFDESMQGYIIFFTDTFLHKKDIVHAVDILEPFLQQYGSPVVHLSSDAESLERNMLDMMYQLAGSDLGDVKPAIVHSHLRTFMLYVHQKSLSVKERRNPADYKDFVRFMELVEEHYKTKHTVKEYADMLHVTTKTVNQYTRRAVDISAKQFIIDRIILEIKRYLSTGELTMSEIAEELGFSEQTNMTKFFKKYTGILPSNFLEQEIEENA